jgi:hypothetical protein
VVKSRIKLYKMKNCTNAWKYTHISVPNLGMEKRKHGNKCPKELIVLNTHVQEINVSQLPV